MKLGIIRNCLCLVVLSGQLHANILSHILPVELGIFQNNPVGSHALKVPLHTRKNYYFDNLGALNLLDQIGKKVSPMRENIETTYLEQRLKKFNWLEYQKLSEEQEKRNLSHEELRRYSELKYELSWYQDFPCFEDFIQKKTEEAKQIFSQHRKFDFYRPRFFIHYPGSDTASSDSKDSNLKMAENPLVPPSVSRTLPSVREKIELLWPRPQTRQDTSPEDPVAEATTADPFVLHSASSLCEEEMPFPHLEDSINLQLKRTPRHQLRCQAFMNSHNAGKYPDMLMLINESGIITGVNAKPKFALKLNEIEIHFEQMASKPVLSYVQKSKQSKHRQYQKMAFDRMFQQDNEPISGAMKKDCQLVGLFNPEDERFILVEIFLKKLVSSKSSRKIIAYIYDPQSPANSIMDGPNPSVLAVTSDVGTQTDVLAITSNVETQTDHAVDQSKKQP